MTAEVRTEMNTLLVEQVDSFAAMIEQRDLARDTAICLEQELGAAESLIKVLRDALTEINNDGCTKYTMANGACLDHSTDPTKLCIPCYAQMILDETKP